MNDKDLKKLTLGIEPDGNDIMIIQPHPAHDGRVLLNKSVKGEFMQCMALFLEVKSDYCKNPVIIMRNGIPAFSVTINYVPLNPIPTKEESLIVNPTGKPLTE